MKFLDKRVLAVPFYERPTELLQDSLDIQTYDEHGLRYIERRKSDYMIPPYLRGRMEET